MAAEHKITDIKKIRNREKGKQSEHNKKKEKKTE